MATLGIPYFLEDKTGLLTSSDFTDVNDRMRLTLRCTLKDSTRSAYMIHTNSSRVPAAALDFGSKGELGTVTINVSALGGVGGGRPHGVGRASLSAGKTRSMKEWLVKVNPFGRSVLLSQCLMVVSRRLCVGLSGSPILVILLPVEHFMTAITLCFRSNVGKLIY